MPLLPLLLRCVKISQPAFCVGSFDCLLLESAVQADKAGNH